MDHYQQFGILYSEARRLYLEGFDEAAAYDRLHMDQRFSIVIQLSDIQKLYRKFQENDQLKAEKDQLRRLMGQIDKKAQLEGEKDQLRRLVEQIDKKFELLSAEHYMIKPDRRNAKKHLISSNMKSKFSGSFLKFWQGRYALGYLSTPDLEVHTFEVFDMFHQKLKQVTVQSHGNFVEFYALADPFLLLLEVSPDSAPYYVSLVEFEPDDDSMQVIQTIERPNHVEIHVDSIDSKKFIIQNDVHQNNFVRGDVGNQDYIIQLSKLVNGQIQIDKEVLYQASGYLFSYSDGKLYSFVQRRRYENEILRGPIVVRSLERPVVGRSMMRQMLIGFDLKWANMQIFDLGQGKNTVVDMKLFPLNIKENLKFFSGHYCEYTWMCDRFFVEVKFEKPENHGIIFANAETQNWSILDFAFKFKIRHIQFINADLMAYTEKEKQRDVGEEIKDNVYKFQMRKPDRLRSMAWKKHVKFIKESTEAEDPYEAALPYLPYNSDVQPFRRIN